MKTCRLLTAFLVLALFSSRSFAQTPVYLGLGMGFDYGGLGIKAEVQPLKHLSLFGGLGYNFNGAGYNVGVEAKFAHDKKVIPFLIAMYGYNAVIRVDAMDGTVAETYYGPSAGFGIDLFTGNGNNKLTMTLLAPFRSSRFKDDYDALKHAGVDFRPGVLPIAFSIGYNFRLNPSNY